MSDATTGQERLREVMIRRRCSASSASHSPCPWSPSAGPRSSCS